MLVVRGHPRQKTLGKTQNIPMFLQDNGWTLISPTFFKYVQA